MKDLEQYKKEELKISKTALALYLTASYIYNPKIYAVGEDDKEMVFLVVVEK